MLKKFLPTTALVPSLVQWSFGLFCRLFISSPKHHRQPFTAFWEDFHISGGNSTNSIAEQTTCQIAFSNGHWPPQMLNPHTITAVWKLFHTAFTLTPGLWETWAWEIWGESCWVCLSVCAHTHTQTRKYSYVVLREPMILKKISASQRLFWLVESVWSVTHARCILIRQASIGMSHHSVSRHSVNHSNHTGYTKWPKSNDLIKELVNI